MESSNQNAEGKKQTGRWSKQEHQRFMLGLMNYGKDWKKVQDIVGTRSGSQVRSHAQKFFNKLQKNPKGSKGEMKLKLQNDPEDQIQMNENSITQNDTLKGLIQQQNSQQTPLQLVSLIKKQSHDTRKVNLASFREKLQKNQEKQDNKNQNLKGLSSFKSMNNILSAYEALNQNKSQENHLEQDQSFLIGITKKYKRFFSKGGQFQNLIDFGNPNQVAKAEQVYHSIRKKSFTLAQGIEGDEHELQDIRNKLKECKQTTATQNKLTPIEQNKIISAEKDQKNLLKQQNKKRQGDKVNENSENSKQGKSEDNNNKNEN